MNRISIETSKIARHMNESTKRKVLSILPVLGHPRHSKRIAMLQRAGFRVETVAFERDYHAGRLPPGPVEVLGRLSHANYVQRLAKLMTVLPPVRRAIRRNHAVYAFGPDMAFLALLAGVGLGRPVFVEVGDIHAAQTSRGFKGYMIRQFERGVVNSCARLIVTADGFIDAYYRKRLNVGTQSLVIENKMDGEDGLLPRALPTEHPAGPPDQVRPIRIGYFGLLRCEWSWKVLETLAKRRPNDVEVLVAGFPACSVDFSERAKELGNVSFVGSYKSPQDLPDLYGNVDLVWICERARFLFSEPDKPGWCWARSNRFYESCYFGTPLVCAAGSGDGNEVQRRDIGLVVQSRQVDDVVDSLAKIRPNDLRRWKRNLSKLPRSVFEYTTEDEELKQAILKGKAA